MSTPAVAEAAAPEGGAQIDAAPSWAELVIRQGGVVGFLIILLSVLALTLVIDHLITIRRSQLIPPRLVEQVDTLLSGRRYAQARELCNSNVSFLARVLGAGLAEVGMGPTAIDRAMEEAAHERAARLARRTEYLSLIGNIAPMLGLLGTVIGMIAAFKAVAHLTGPDKAPALAEGIYHALITTCMGLIVAIPCLGGYSIFRNRADQLAAEAALTAEQIMGPLLRGNQTADRPAAPTPTSRASGGHEPPGQAGATANAPNPPGG